MTTPHDDIAAAARSMGRKGGKARSGSKIAASRENGTKGGRPVRYFDGRSITPFLLRRVAAMSAAASGSLYAIARDAEDGTIGPATAARAANLAMRDLIRATKGGSA